MDVNEKQNGLDEEYREPDSLVEGAYCLIDARASIWGEEPGQGPHSRPSFGPGHRPGFKICHFVREFVSTPVGDVPRIKTYWTARDYACTALARLGLVRNSYKVVPGLYCAGFPDKHAPVLVVANHKLMFDLLRRELAGIDAWILVIDTEGVDVWRASWRKFFSTKELVRVVRASRLRELVSHRQIIVPQSAATGVGARKVKGECGFDVVFGPMRFSDLQAYFENGMEATPQMRAATFTLSERAMHVPVHLHLLTKQFILSALLLLVLSGIGPDILSFARSWSRFQSAFAALFVGTLSGGVLLPLLLPIVPGVRFAVKGICVGLPLAFLLLLLGGAGLTPFESVALVALTLSASSYSAMEFAKLTPFASKTGIDRETRCALPWQIAGFGAFAVLWCMARFGA